MNNSQHDLLLQYKKARRDLAAAHRLSAIKDDRSQLAQMIGEVEYVIEWLSTGRQPSARRGIDRRSVYELTQVWDPEWFKAFVAPVASTSEYELTLADEFSLDDVMTDLSERERQCYVLHHGFGYSLRDMAAELNVTVRTVRTHMERAEQKIEQNKRRGLSLTG